MADISTVKEITDKLETGVKELFESDKYAAYLQTMSRFHKYSTRNTILIHIQYPQASRVAGYSSWKNKFNRQVKKGEHGIKIFAPIPFMVKEEVEKLDPVTKKPILDENGQPVMEEYVKARSARFKVVNVFDIAQTDGEPLPELAETLTGDVERFDLFLDALRAVSPLPIVFEDLPANTDGRCIFGDRIAIRSGMSEIQTVSAAIHEITHSKLHDLEALRLADPNAKPKDRHTEEVEAESIAFSVNCFYNIDTGANSFGYIAEWSRGKELKELNASLDVIRKTAAELIDGIDAQYRALAKERGIDLSTEAPKRETDSQTPQTDMTEQKPYTRGGLKNDAKLIAAREKYGEGSFEYDTIKGDMEMSFTEYADILSDLNKELSKRGYNLENAEHNSQDYLNEYIDEVDIHPDESDAAKIADFIVERVKLPLEQNPALETTGAKLPDNPAAAKIINEYARNARASAPLRVGTSVLMAPVFIDGNFNRAGKKTHVTVEEPIGKYQVFSRDENGDKNLYFLTASGMVDRISEYFRDQWSEEQGEWVKYRPTEAELDEVLMAVSERFEQDLAQPDKWAKYQHAAALNRVDECEKHNEPVRELRVQERKIEAAEAARKEQEENRLKEEKYNARIVEIEDAIKNGAAIKVGYNEGDYDGKNPVLDLFKRHNIALPLKTQGWVNSGLAEITASSYRYYKSKHGGNSTTFGAHLDKLRDAIKTAHIEQGRPSASVETPKQALDMSVPDPTVTAAKMNEYGYAETDMHPLSPGRALELYDTGHTVYLLYPDNTESVAIDREEIRSHDGYCGVTHADWDRSPVFKAQLAVASNAAVGIEGKHETELLHSGFPYGYNPYAPENKFGIYQIRGSKDSASDLRFLSMSELEARNLAVDRSNYELVYTAPFNGRTEFLSDRNSALNQIYEKFNIDHPDDYKGRSVSVSDVIVLRFNGDISAHYVDSVGFVELDKSDFFKEKAPKTQTAEKLAPPATETKQPQAKQMPAAPKSSQSIMSRLAQAQRIVANTSKPAMAGNTKETRGRNDV